MNQVVRNLVSNALKFTPVGRSVVIRVRKVLISDPDVSSLPESDHQSSVGGGSSKALNSDRVSMDIAWFGSSKTMLSTLSSFIPRTKNFSSTKSRDSGINSEGMDSDVELGTVGNRGSAKSRTRADSVPTTTEVPGIDSVALAYSETTAQKRKKNSSSKSNLLNQLPSVDAHLLKRS